MLNPDYKDMLVALCEEKTDFLIVGAYALAVYGLPRATGDIDLFVGEDVENSKKVYRALQRFGAPLSDIHPETFTQKDVIFQIGVAPSRIDILTSITGVSFSDAWPHRKMTEVEGLSLAVLSMDDMIINKSATGRPKDKLDVEWLKAQKRQP
ncbi:MAG TPA: DUF6036 family nucleotidyltransferase [bacterium]|jgi:hypothetical protein|nr:DUF6036 family nucleotidyltransferase [bacterium]